MAGVVATILVVGILCSCRKLKHFSEKDFQVKFAEDVKCEMDE